MLVESQQLGTPVLGAIEKQDVALQLPVGVMKSIAALRI